MKLIITLLASFVSLATLATDLLDGQGAAPFIRSAAIQSGGATDFAEWPQISRTWNRFTNVVTGDNHRGCPFRNTTTEIAPGVLSTTLLYHPHHEGCTTYVAPTERWTITTVGIRHTASIAGFPGFLSKDEIISCSTNREVLESKWVKTDQSIGGGGQQRSLEAYVPVTTTTNVLLRMTGAWTNSIQSPDTK